MINLYNYITERIKSLSSDKKGIIVFDIDDTILKADSSTMSIYKKTLSGEISLSTDEYAKDPDAGIVSKSHLFDFRDFNDPKKVYQSIIQGTPLIKNLRIMDAYINAGYEFCFLTARGCEDVIKDALDSFLKTKTPDGGLKRLGKVFNKTLSHAINDKLMNYPGKTDSEKKANVLINLCNEYDKVIFVDDDKKNVIAAKQLGLNNLTVIKAWK